MNKYIKQISDRIFKNVLIAEFKDKTVLITGGAKRIGLAIKELEKRYI